MPEIPTCAVSSVVVCFCKNVSCQFAVFPCPLGLCVMKRSEVADAGIPLSGRSRWNSAWYGNRSQKEEHQSDRHRKPQLPTPKPNQSTRTGESRKRQQPLPTIGIFSEPFHLWGSPSSATAAGNARSAATIADKSSEPSDCSEGRRFATPWLGIPIILTIEKHIVISNFSSVPNCQRAVKTGQGWADENRPL